MSELLGRAVLDEVRESDRVLDMGTGSGVNAILAASKSAQVVAVDINAAAIECARANAVRNGVADRIEFLETDVFSGVNGRFDLVVFDPPFRWFSPRTMLERASTDENYSAMTRFFSEIDEYLAENGRVLIFFGTSGDIDYLKGLIEGAGLTLEQISTQNLEKNRQTVSYFAFRLHR
jgi:release factor glutamine methyltransferase